MHAETNEIEKKNRPCRAAWPAVAPVVEVGAELRKWPGLRSAQAGGSQRTRLDRAAGAQEGILLGWRQKLQGRTRGGEGC
jgi:hypothetical protein